MNRGLSPSLIEAFPDTIPVIRPSVQNPIIPHPQWVAGFASGDGSFWVSLRNSSTGVAGGRVTLTFVLTQHKRDEVLPSEKTLVDYFRCGNCYNYTAKESMEFKCRAFLRRDIQAKIIPFFSKYPIVGVKSLDFEDWCKIANIMKTRDHLTKNRRVIPSEEICQIESGMNKSR